MRLLAALLSACALTATASAAPDGGIRALQAFYANVDSLRADFLQVQVDESGDILQQMSGLFLLERPDRFRWEYTEPYSQIIVSDGQAFRFYDVGLSQVTIRPVNDSLSTTPAQLLAGGTALDDAFAISNAGTHDGLSWVKLVPREDSSDFRAITIGLDGHTPAAMQLDDKLGQTTRILFKNVETDVAIDAQRFTLDLPEGVTVVDGRAGKPSTKPSVKP